ncbi:MAG: hypothetical protein C4555_02580 [Dehalococcoidia bacterium]|jgi:hypothetical protein|nr:MAG: hypothetical protein C4555_02580 [Dehalococcoidia bacterium]
MMPGTNGKLVSRKGAKVEKVVFKRIMDDYYQARGWDIETGLFRENSLTKISLTDMILELERHNFVAHS